MKIDRLISIIMMLINKRKVTAKELAEYFEVSVRTIQRDMDNLTVAGIPIYSDVGKNGGYSIVNDYKLDKNFLSKDEAKLLLAFLSNFQESIPYAEAKSVSNKLSAILPEQSSDEKLIIKMSPSMSSGFISAIIGDLAKARDQYQKVEITYIDSNFNETRRVVCPYRLVMMGTTWYVYGFCEKRKAFRLFKVVRIIDCKILSEAFEEMEMPSPLPWENLMDSAAKNVDMILEIDLCLKGKIPEYFDYRSCQVLEDKIVVSLSFPVDEWLFSLLMGMVPHIKVIEPAWLKEEMAARMIKGIKKMTSA